LDAIITADEGVRQRFKQLGSRTEVIYNFPRLDLFSYPDKSIIPKFDLVYHGSLPRYHLENCFSIDDALVRLNKRVNWLLFGSVADLPWVQKNINCRQAQERIIIGGMVPHEHVTKKILQARIGIIPLPNLPKFHHNIPTKLFEFMALGMPVILSDLPPSRPFVGDGKCAIMVPADDFHAYAENIISLIETPDLCQKMGEEGQRRVKNIYNWETQAKKLINLYNSLIK
jgi:glycosyltransferase involved in cell wall biosynthesis